MIELSVIALALLCGNARATWKPEYASAPADVRDEVIPKGTPTCFYPPAGGL